MRGAAVVMGLVLAGYSAAAPHVPVIEHDGSDYSRATADGRLARQQVAQRFYETHSDQYDFLIVFPTFAANFGQNVAGLHTFVSNDVSGTGKPVGSNASLYGSAGRLKGYIDIDALMPGASAPDLDDVMGVVAHEIAHQWSGQAKVLLAGAAASSNDLLGQEGGHWSFFLDSNASLLNGSEWVANGNGTFTAVESRRRYSELDLYLMGFYSPLEVPPMAVLRPSGPGHSAEEIPPPDGTVVAASATSVEIANIVAAMGARVPNASAAQHEFRAAFVLLLPPGAQATPAQFAFVEAARRQFANEFFFLTHGRGVMETELVDVSPAAVSANPSVLHGLAALLALQQASGAWADSAGTTTRETTAALEALSSFNATPEVLTATTRGGDWLAQSGARTTDTASRRLLGLSAAHREVSSALGALELFRAPSAGFGPAPGFSPTAIDSALAAIALLEGGRSAASISSMRAWLLSQQRADGSWPLTPGGPGRIESTALVLSLLSRVGSLDNPTAQVVARGLAWLRARRSADGSFKDDLASASTTAHAVLSLAEWHQLTAAEATSASTFLLSQQRPDGSWAGSAYQTAEALKALRAALSVNVSIAAVDVNLSSSVVSEGEPVIAEVLVRNTGLTTASSVAVQAFDSSGAALSPVQTISSIEPGSARITTLRLDTHSHAGSTQVFVVVDPAGTLEESREDDNRVALALIIKPAPVLPDLFVAQGSVGAVPSEIRGPTSIGVSATVGNSGQTAVTGAIVSLLIDGAVVATTTLSIPAGGSAPLSLSVSVVTGPAAIEVVVDPQGLIEEDSETNNRAALTVPVVNTVDLELATLTAAPPSAPQGADIVLSYSIHNRGTLEAAGTVAIDILDSAGATVASIPGVGAPVPVGGTTTATATWRAGLAGTFTARARVTTTGDVQPANDLSDATFTVTQSSLANLIVRPADLSVSPSPLLEGQAGTVTVRVANLGGAAGAFEVELYLGDPAAGGVLLRRETVSGLAAQGSVNVSAPLPTVTAAQLSIVAVVDTPNAVAEFDEDDNRAVATFAPASIPELVVSAADVRPQNAFPRVGDVVPVEVSVFNQGDQDATNVTVELFLGSASGTPVGAVTLAQVAGRSRADASFVLPTVGLTGNQTLVGVANRSRLVTERRYDNNSASRTIVIQDGALALTNPYFSPNGDGSKDTTQLLARIPATESLEVEITDSESQVIRSLAAAPSTATVSWDGRDSQGLVAEDGTYELTAWSVAGATRSLVGSVRAVVDTNHLLVTRTVGTPYFQTELGSGVPTPDDQSVAFAGWVPDGTGANRYGIYLKPVGGGETRRISPDAWSQAQVGGMPAMAPDGRHFANRAYDPALGTTLRLHDFVAHTSRTLVPNVSGNPVFSPDGQSILYFVVEIVAGADERRLELVDVASGGRRVLTLVPADVGDYRFSPDGTLVSYTLGDGRLFTIPAAGGPARQVQFDAPTGRVHPLWGAWDGPPAYAWRASSRELVYSTPGVAVRVVGQPCYEIVYASDYEYSAPAECYLSQGAGLRTFDLTTQTDRPLFSDPGFAFMRFGNESSVVTSPFGRSVLFPYKPLAVASGLDFWPWMTALFGEDDQLHFVEGASNASRVLATISGVQQARVVAWSPGGTFVVTDDRILSSDANLRARVSASRPPGGGRLTLGGNATDWNFQDYELSVRALGSASSTIISRSSQEVRNSRLVEWAPPSPGRYELALKVNDLAGNSRTVTAQAGWSTSPAIASLAIEPQLFSPNGDGTKDSSVVSYFANAPVTTDFVVSDAVGLPTRAFQRTHLSSGNFALAWDGRNEAGQVVRDGDYQVRVEGLSAPFVVDTIPPTASFAIGAFQAGERRVTTTTGARVIIPSVFLERSWQAKDLHFSEWVLEESDTQVRSQFSASKSGRGEQVDGDATPIGLARGRDYRLRAIDGAGNTTVTPAAVVPERFFVTAIGEADRLQYGTWLPRLVDGSLEPAIDMMAPHYGRNMTPKVQVPLESTRYAFAFESTVRAPLVAFSVAYHPLPFGPEIVDTTNVSLLSPHVVVWDARLVAPGSYVVEVRATDAVGNQFADVVTFRRSDSAASCASVTGTPSIWYTIFALPPGSPGNFEAGASVSLVSVGGTAALSSGSLGALTGVGDPNAPVYQQGAQLSLPPSALGCRFEILTQGVTADGSAKVLRSAPIDICAIHAISVSVSSSGRLEADLVETFDRPIESVDLLVGRVGLLPLLVATIPSFSGATHVSAQLPFCGVFGRPQFRVRFSDGSSELTTNYSELPPLGFQEGEVRGCLGMGVNYACQQPALTLAHVQSPPPGKCITQIPSIDLSVVGDAAPGETITRLDLGYSGTAGATSLVTANPAAAHGELATTLDTALLAEGEYFFSASLRQSDGRTMEAPQRASASDVANHSFVVDRTPPAVTFSVPAPNSRLCPVTRRLGDGSLASFLAVSGLVTEANPSGLPSFTLLSSGPTSQQIPLTTASATHPAGELLAPPSGDYEAVIEARDVSGSSSCASVPFHFVGPVSISGQIASPSLFSPDGDGRFDSSLISFSLSEAAEVAVSAKTPAGAVFPITALSSGAGGTTFAWDGRDSTGQPLPDGAYTILLSALDECGSGDEAAVPVHIDRQAPVARIDTPLAGGFVRAVLNVSGEASDQNFERAILRISDGSGTSSILRVSPSPTIGTFGAFPATGLTPGPYTLELEVTDLVGHSSTASSAITVNPSRLLIDVSSAPLVISPNGDGRVDEAVLSFSVQSSANVLVELRLGAALVRQVAALGTVSGAQVVTVNASALGPVADGDYTLHVIAEDASGPEAEEVPLIVDLTPPTLSVSSPVPNAAVAGETPVSGAVTDLHLASWVLGVTSGGASSLVSSGASQASGALGQLVNLTDGVAELELRATDLGGNEAMLLVPFSSDSTAPVVSFQQPLAGAFLSGLDGGPVVVTPDVVEASVAMVTLTAQHGSGAPHVLYSAATVPAGVPWDVAAEADGITDLVLVVRDAAGNQGEARVSVIIDNTPPVALVTAPRDSVLVMPGQFVGTAADTNFVSYLLEVAPGPRASAWQFVTVGSGSAEVTGGVLGTLATAPPDGLYTSRLTVVDRAGNRTVALAEFTSDNTPPAPPVLSLSRGGPSEARLSWTASASTDVVGYVVTRESAASALELPTATLALADPGLADGTHRYRVVAVDAAGLRSAPSNEEPFEADGTPPTVALFAPADGARLRGTSSVIGTAASIDLSEYRLSLGEGASPASFTLLVASPSSVRSAPLASLDTSAMVQGATYTLLLEATDVFGNVGSVSSRFVVDELAPAAPVLVSAVASFSTVVASWQLSPEPDVVGYLLYRNFQLVNGPPGSVADPLLYALPATQSTHTGLNLPDGTFSYQVQAIDAAGNLSPLSNAISVTVNRRTPVASVVSPVNLARLQGPVSVIVDSPDEDVATINVEVRAGAGAWTSLGVLTSQPWTVSLDPAAFASPILEVRATATDTFGASDPAPKAAFYFFSPAPLAPAVSTLVDGSSVSLSWTDPNPPGAVAGFAPRRNGSTLVTAARPAGTATATSGIASRAYDSNFSTRWVSNSFSFPQTWQLDFSAPVLLDGFAVQLATWPTFDVEVRVRGVWVTALRDFKEPNGNSLGVNLAPGLEVEAVRLVIKSDEYGRTEIYDVVPQPAPVVAQSPYLDAAPLGAHAYDVEAVTSFGSRAQGSAGALVYRPTLAGVSPTAASVAPLAGTGAVSGDTVELRQGSVVLATTTADGSGGFAFSAPLVLGDNTFTALAFNAHGDRSLPSDPLSVVRADTPLAAVVLALDAVNGSSVALSFTVSGDTTGVTGYVVARTDGTQSVVAGTVAAAGRTFTDVVANGTWTWEVSARNAAGLVGAPSNSVTATVEAVVPPPIALVVTAPASGGALALSWTWSGIPAQGFRLERAASATGPFDVVTGAEALGETSYLDTGLTEGSTWWYRVFARDGVGNLSAASNVASGTAHDAIAPIAPRLTAPTKPGAPLVVTSPLTTVRGFAEGGSEVTLTRNGASMGTRFTGAEVFEHTPVSTAFAWWNAFGASADGRRVAYGYWGPDVAIGIEDVTTHGFVAVDTAGRYPLRLAFSPDGSKLAAELQSPSDGSIHLFVVSTATGAMVPLLATPGTEESWPIWSADSSLLAYAAIRPPAFNSVGVSAVGSGTETVLGAPNTDLQSPAVLVAGQLVVPGYDNGTGQYVVVSFDLQANTQQTLLASWEGFGGVVGAPGQARIALSSWSEAITSLDVLTGQQVTVGSGRVFGVSSDGAQLLWASGSQLRVSSLDDLHLTALDSTFDPFSDMATWLGPDAVLHFMSSGLLDKVEWGGLFEFPGVQLAPGVNDFVAVARDEGGNDSPPSASIRVTYDASTTADLTPELALLPAIPIATQPGSVMVTVRNLGGGPAAPADVLATVIGADGSLRSSSPARTTAIGPGQAVVVAVPLDLQGLSGAGNSVRVVVDPSGAVPDSNRANNAANLDFSIAASANLGLTVRALPGSVQAFGAVTAEVSLLNPAQPKDVSVRLFLTSPDGTEALAIPPAEVFAPFATGASASFSRTFNVGALLADGYEVVAEATSGGQVLARATAPLTVERSPSAAVTVRSSRAQYVEGELAQLSATVTNTSVNTMLPQASLRLDVVDSAGAIAFTQTSGLPVLTRNDSTTTSASVPVALPAGVYAIHAVATEGSTVLGTGTTSFTVVSRPVLRGDLSINGGTSSPAVATAGVAASLDLQVRNLGSASAAAVEASLVLSTTRGAVVSSQTLAVGSLAGGGTFPSTVPLSTAGLPTGLYAVSLVLSATGIAPFEAATRTLRLTDGEPPVLEVLGLTQGALVSAHPVARVRARDDSGVAAARVSVDGVTSPLSAVSGFSQDGEWALQLAVSDGPHTLVFSAVDVDGNDGLTSPRATNPVTVSFVTDSTPPVITITGVTEGELSAIAVTPQVSVVEANPGSVLISLNGVAFTSGTPVTADGAYVLEVVATDAAGNQASRRLAFEVDGTPPLLGPLGFAEGAFTRNAVTPGYTVSDAHPVTASASLDGAALVPGQLVTAEGAHLLTVVATDSAGNTATLNAGFTIDTTPPQVGLAGFVHGEVTSRTVLPAATATDTNLLSLEARLDGAPFATGGSVHTEGAHLFEASAVDKAGNVATASGSFTIDTVSPELVISGVTEGQLSRGALVPVVTVNELHPATQTALLNGVPFASGTLVLAEGQYTLLASATDAAGNTATTVVHFGIDATPPLITVSGVVDGQVGAALVTPVVVVSDANLAATTATLDGLPFVSGDAVGTEGAHTLSVVAADSAGNSSSATVSFTIDRTAPVILISGVSDGEVSPSTLTPFISVIDATATSTAVLLSAAPFTSGSAVSAEGNYQLAVTASDAAGNTATALVSFSIDLTPPSVTLSGFVDGSVVRGPVTPGFSVSELHPGTTTATLNGQAFVAGAVVTTEGLWTLTVAARDAAGHTATASGSFTIDVTSPVITVTGVADGQVSAGTLTPVVAFADAHLAGSTLLLNGAPLVSGTPVTAEGDYVLEISAVDAANNTASRTVSFSIDTTAPLVTVAGVADGAVSAVPVTPVILVSDAHPASSSATLDGLPFSPGTTVSVAGAHTLSVTATDAAGNASTVTVHFTLQTAQPTVRIDKAPLGTFTRTLAFVESRGCQLRASEVARLETFLTTSLGGPGQVLSISWSQSGFLSELRGGQYNVYLVLDVGMAGCGDDDDDEHHDGDGCGDEHHGGNHHDDDHDDGHDDDGAELAGSWLSSSNNRHAMGNISKAIADELTEQVYGGHAGLVLVDALNSQLDLREVTGVSMRGSLRAVGVQFAAGPLSPGGPLAVVGRPRELRLNAASPLAAYTPIRLRADAVASSLFGAGKAVTFGFDLTRATPALDSQLTLSRAVALVTPPPAAASALALFGVALHIENTGAPLNATVRETLTQPLYALDSLPAATLSNLRRQLEWQVPLSTGQSVPLDYWVRLPDALGSWPTTTDVRSGGVSIVQQQSSLSVTQSGPGLLADAQAAARLLATTGSVGSRRAAILSRLNQVQTRTISSRSDVEQNLSDLLFAAERASGVQGTAGAQVRAQLSHLILYWEARWYVY